MRLSSPRLLVLLLLLGGGLATWLLFQDDQGTASKLAPLSVGAPLVSPGRPAETKARTKDAAALQTVPFRQKQSSASKVAPGPGRGILVRVVEAQSGAPVPWAEVYVAPPASLDSLEGRRLLAAGTDPLLFMRKLGTRHPCDGQGELRLPDSGANTLLLARKGDTQGAASLHQVQGNILRIELSPALSIPLAVVDWNGRPCGQVPVVFLRHAGRKTNRLATALTRRDGSAHLRLLSGKMVRQTEDAAATFGVAIDLPFKSSTEVPWTPTTPTPQTLVLTLPPSGTLVVQIKDASGAPFRDEGLGTLRKLEGRAKPAPLPPPRTSRPWEAPCREGRLVFLHVPLAQRFRLSVKENSLSMSLKKDVAGPRRAGQTLAVTLALPANKSLLLLQVLDHEGRPLKKTSLKLLLLEASRTQAATLVTDGEGLVRIMPEHPYQAGSRRSLVIGRRDAASGLLSFSAAAQVDISRFFPPGETRLGKVRLAKAPLIVSGKVVDLEGHPLGGVHLSLSRRSGQARVPWQLLWRRQVLSTPDGSFEERGWIGGGAIRLWVRKEKRYLVGAPPEVPQGTTGLVVRMGLTGEVSGSVRDLGKEWPAGLHLHLEGEDVPLAETRRKGWASQDLHLLPEGHFTMTRLRPGSYRLTFLDVLQNPFLRITGIHVKAGKNRPPELQELELSKAALGVEVKVLDPRGQPLQGALVTFATRRTSVGGPTNAAGIYRAFATREVEVLSVSAKGFRRQILRPLSPNITVRLVPEVMVTFLLKGARPLPRGLFRLLARLQPSGKQPTEGLLLRTATDMEFPPRQKSLPRPMTPGSYRVSWRIAARLGQPLHPLQLFSGTHTLKPPQTITVREGEGQVVALGITPAILNRCMGELGRQVRRFVKQKR